MIELLENIWQFLLYEYKEIDNLIFFKLRISVYTHKKTSKRKQMSWQVDHWSKSV